MKTLYFRHNEDDNIIILCIIITNLIAFSSLCRRRFSHCVSHYLPLGRWSPCRWAQFSDSATAIVCLQLYLLLSFVNKLCRVSCKWVRPRKMFLISSYMSPFCCSARQPLCMPTLTYIYIYIYMMLVLIFFLAVHLFNSIWSFRLILLFFFLLMYIYFLFFFVVLTHVIVSLRKPSRWAISF